MKMRFIGVLFILLISCGLAFSQTTDDLWDTNTLQEIRLDVKPEDWAALKANPQADTYYPADFHWRGITVTKVGIRHRGNSTRSGIKPHLKVDFNQYVSGQDFLGVKSLILKNNAQDASMIKDRIVMEVFAKMGLPAEREVNGTLYVNGEYYGVYSIIESIDKQFLTRVFGENSGYLYSYEYAFQYHFENLGSDPALYSPVLFEPQTHEDKPDPAPLVKMIQTMNTASDTNFATAMAPYIDLSLFMKHLAVETFMAETDGLLSGMNNFNLYRFKSGISQLIPQGKDLTFGGPYLNPNRPQTPLLPNVARNVLMRRALNVPAARNSYVSMIRSLNQLAGKGGWLEQEVTRMANQIRSAVQADPVRICFTGQTTQACTDPQFELEVAGEIDFARQRGDFALSQLTQISTQQLYSFNNPGAFSVTKPNTLVTVNGFGLVDPDNGSAKIDGVAILSNKQNNITISETGIPASAAIRHCTIYIDTIGTAQAALAIANSGTTDATISFSLTDATGNTFGQGNLVVRAGTQISQYVDQAPFSSGSVRATLTLDSSQPVFVTALRSFTNERSELLWSTLPVVGTFVSGGTSIIPQFVDGGGLSTQIILVNPSTNPMTGNIQLVDQQTQAATTVSGYTIPPMSFFRYQTPGTAASVKGGFVRIVPLNLGNVPAAFGLFGFKASNGVTMTEAVLTGAIGSTSYHFYTESSATIKTGIAVANPSSVPVVATFSATDLNGNSTGLTGTMNIPGNGQAAAFIDQLPGFEKLDPAFQGVVTVSTTSASGIVVGVSRGRFNERGEFLMTTTPAIDDLGFSLRSQIGFPQFFTGNGYSTQFILFGGKTVTASGVLRLFDQTGFPVSIQ